TEDNVVQPACIDNPDWSDPLGDGATVTATMPAAACATYGPDTPPGGFRPRDPDPSGGYYQPVRAALADAPLAFGLPRLAGALAADATGAGEVAWTAPPTTGPVHAWAVLHDDRGGVATATLTLDVR